jgi:hypothetical protein
VGTAAAVIVGLAQAYIAPSGTAAPAITSTSTVVSCTPTTPWAAIGFTESGVTINVDRKVTNIMVEEQSTPILVVPDTTDVTIDITLSEDTILNMQTAYGGGTITTVAAASPSTPGQTILTLADALETLAICFTATNSFGFTRLVYIPTVISGGKVKTTYSRAKANRSYPATFSAVCPMSSIVITDATAVE